MPPPLLSLDVDLLIGGSTVAVIFSLAIRLLAPKARAEIQELQREHEARREFPAIWR